MNKELLRKISSVLRGEIDMRKAAPQIKNPEFDMRSYARSTVGRSLGECGTAMCIAGWALALSGRTVGEINTCVPCGSAADVLGLDRDTAEELFHPVVMIPWNKIKPHQAAAVIDHLIETGEVDWESFT